MMMPTLGAMLCVSLILLSLSLAAEAGPMAGAGILD
jgi:hypothetical protein